MRALPSRSASGVQELSRRLLNLSLAGSILLAAPVLRAEDGVGPASPTPSASALHEGSESGGVQRARRMLLERAKQRYDAGRRGGEDAKQQLESALDALLLAYQLSPAPWLLFNLAQVRSQLGHCDEAAELYRRFLASEPGPAARASAGQALHLLGACDTPGTQPELDDALLPGLREASSLESLNASGAPSPLPASSEESAPDREDVRVWPWAFAGVAATAGAAAVVFYGQAHAAQQDLDRIRIGGPQVAETQQRGESALTFARVFGGIALGFGLAAGASFWWPRAEPDEAPHAPGLARLSLLPLERGAGAAYGFEF
jgi:tetratricopeptide (TPR) repeat protein